MENETKNTEFDGVKETEEALEQTKEEKSSASLYAYTALIFIVAIMMIVLAFFGQSNLDYEKDKQAEGKSITEKSAALSNENLLLHDRISDLNEELEAKDIELASEKATNDKNARLMSAQVLVNIGNYEEAERVLLTIEKESITGDSLEIYNDLTDKIKQNIKKSKKTNY